MKIAFFFTSMLVPVLLSSQAAAPANTTTQTGENTGLATLHALDPISRTLCLKDGKPGGVFQNDEVRNRCSDIDFNSYNSGHFTVGIEGSRQGNILDVGTADDLMKKYGYAETVGRGQGFASLRIEGSRIVIANDTKTGSVQELQGGTAFLQTGRKGAAAAVRLGHIYLVRLTDTNDKAFNRMAKLIVVDYRPNESVTVRWALMQ